jgi:hypothetical protein
MTALDFENLQIVPHLVNLYFIDLIYFFIFSDFRLYRMIFGTKKPEQEKPPPLQMNYVI